MRGTPSLAGRAGHVVRRTGAHISREPYHIALSILIILNISRFHQHFPFLGALRPAMLLVLMLAAFAVLKPGVVSIRSVTQTWPMRVVGGIAALACFSVLFGISQGHAGKFVLEQYSKVLIGAVLVAAAIRSPKDLNSMIWAYVIGCGILSYFALFVFKPEVTPSGLVRLGDGYTWDANDIGCVLSIGLPLALLTFQTSAARGKLLSAIILVGIGMTLALSGSRGGFLGFVAVGAALLIMLKQVALVKRATFVAVVLLAIIWKAPPGYWKQMQTVTTPTQDYNWTSVDGRKQVALRGITYMLQYPVFGIGVSNFPMAEGTISTKARRHVPGTGLKWSAAHNSHIEAGSEMGFPGALLWLTLQLGGIVGMIRLRRRFPAKWARGSWEEQFLYYSALYLPIAMIGFAVTSSFVSFAYNDPIYLLAAYMSGLYVLVSPTRRFQSGASSRPRHARRPGAGTRGSRVPFGQQLPRSA